MAERKSLSEASRAIDGIFRKLEDAMGSEMAMKLTLEINEAKGVAFDVVLDQASFDRLYEFNNAPPELVLRASAEQSRRDNEITAGAYKVQAEVMTPFGPWKEMHSQSQGEDRPRSRADAVGHDVGTRQELRPGAEMGLTPENEAIVYEFRRPKEEAGAAGRPIEFPRDYEIAATVHGRDVGGEQGLHEAMQVAESSGRYLVRTGDVISAPSGTDYRITEDGIRVTGGKIQFTAAETTWEVMPARGRDRGEREVRPTPMADAEIAKAVEHDVKTWKQVRSEGREGGGKGSSVKGPEARPNEARER